MTDDSDDRPITDRRFRRGPDPEEEALGWIARMTSGEAGEGEKAAFARWVAVPANAIAYAELEDIWNGLGNVFEPRANVVPFKPRPRASVVFQRRAAGIAACIAVFGLTAQQYYDYWRYDATTRGSARATEELADGSRIEMNTGAALDVSYGADVRRVTLARGEAFFDVKRDPSKPFIIKAGAGEVRVLGTAFSVKREGDGARVTVIRGKVRVASAGKFVDITPNQQVRFDGGAPQAVRRVDAETLLAWSEGRLVLRNRPLGEVLDAVDRYYPGAIILTDDAAAKKRVDAVVNLNRIDDWVRQLQSSQNLTARRFPGVLVLSGS
ncbi:FecR family protein [Sphingopyxis fribergensis]